MFVCFRQSVGKQSLYTLPITNDEISCEVVEKCMKSPIVMLLGSCGRFFSFFSVGVLTNPTYPGSAIIMILSKPLQDVNILRTMIVQGWVLCNNESGSGY